MKINIERQPFWRKLLIPKFVRKDATLCPECDETLRESPTLVTYFDPKMREAECVDRTCERCGYEERELVRKVR